MTSQVKVIVNDIEISPSFSILKKPVNDSIEVKISKNERLWLYENGHSSMPKRVSVKQLKFLSNLISFFANCQKDPSNYRFIASRFYIPPKVVDEVASSYLFKEKLFEYSPLALTRELIEYLTLNLSEFFTLSFFSLLSLGSKPSQKDLSRYFREYRYINREVLKLFKALMKSEIVFITNSLFGDYLIYPQIPNWKTTRNIKVFNEKSYIVPIDKVSIFDLVGVYHLSSTFKIAENIAIGKLSKKKIQDINSPQLLKDLQKVLNRLNLSRKLQL
ncbi:MAG: hypothetical protein ABDH28_06970 [Brevinematia bacterium]